MKRCIAAAVCALATLTSGAVRAETFIVQNGRRNAEIVVGEEPMRMAALAASELQTYVQRITGAELPIVNHPTDGAAVKVYVGRSEHTDRLGVTDEGLNYGAFRMVSGPDWLALLGHDTDFEPVEPWARNHGDRERAQAEWMELTGAAWVNPMNNLFRRYNRATDTWEHQQGGSFNAVCEFLRSLGVRWYMPGNLGQVVPELESIPLPALDKTVRPDFPIRFWHSAYMALHAETETGPDGLTHRDVMWERRLGMNSVYEVLGSGMYVHGMRLLHGRPEMQEAHPEYYAMRDGARDTDFRGSGHACFSSEGLLQEAVSFARAVFDHFGEPALSLWPQDGYRQCQCELCEGKSASELVWGFVDRAARELYKTHPDRLVTCGAYAQYREPPETIETFSPNVAVFICNVRRQLFDQPDRWEWYWDMVQSWHSKVAPGQIIRNENNRWGVRPNPETPVVFPVFHPRMFVKDLRALKGVSLGDWNEVSRTGMGVPGGAYWSAPGIDHLNLYVNSRYLWDVEQDLDELLEEYYTLFYGPARDEMKAAIEFAEATYNRVVPGRRGVPDPRAVSLADRVRLGEMLHAAREAAGDTVYGQRIHLMIGELAPLDTLRRELRRQEDAPDPRADAPTAVARDTGHPEGMNTYRLRELRTGEEADIETTFRVGWDDGALYFDIRCQEPDMGNLAVAEDVASGDHVAILLETTYHTYYKISVNPEGEVLDADRHDGAPTRWMSQAEVRTQRGEGFWRVEVRLPVMDEEAGGMDPIHYVVGEKPTPEAPWYFNVVRTRARRGEQSLYGFSPKGSEDRVPESFGRLEIR